MKDQTREQMIIEEIYNIATETYIIPEIEDYYKALKRIEEKITKYYERNN